MSNPAVRRDCRPGQAGGASPAVPSDVAVEVGSEIDRALERIPPDHRVGFLFGMVVGKLDEQGMNETQVRGEIVKGLALIYQNQEPEESAVKSRRTAG